jgi:hypothetical protein
LRGRLRLWPAPGCSRRPICAAGCDK